MYLEYSGRTTLWRRYLWNDATSPKSIHLHLIDTFSSLEIYHFFEIQQNSYSIFISSIANPWLLQVSYQVLNCYLGCMLSKSIKRGKVVDAYALIQTGTIYVYIHFTNFIQSKSIKFCAVFSDLTRNRYPSKLKKPPSTDKYPRDVNNSPPKRIILVWKRVLVALKPETHSHFPCDLNMCHGVLSKHSSEASLGHEPAC